MDEDTVWVTFWFSPPPVGCEGGPRVLLVLGLICRPNRRPAAPSSSERLPEAAEEVGGGRAATVAPPPPTT